VEAVLKLSMATSEGLLLRGQVKRRGGRLGLVLWLASSLENMERILKITLIFLSLVFHLNVINHGATLAYGRRPLLPPKNAVYKPSGLCINAKTNNDVKILQSCICAMSNSREIKHPRKTCPKCCPYP